MVKFLLRDEARPTERRAPIIPDHAAELLEQGLVLDVESSRKRIFPDERYQQAGCKIVPAGSWHNASADTAIVGLKELPDEPKNLTNPMVHFAHLYKEQTGWREELQRFARGGGALYDIEYLAKEGRRVAAFGYWAGWMGAALASWRFLAKQSGKSGPVADLVSFDNRDAIINALEALAGRSSPKAIVIGAKGRSGNGAIDALKIAGATITQWDIEETANLDRDTLLSHDILVNCVLLTGPGLLLATRDHLKSPASRLQMISDVACDPFSSFNPLPIYAAPTSWQQPFVDLGQNGQGKAVELTAIDNLPSLVPKESSEDFSAQFAPCLKNFPDGEEWQAAAQMFARKLAEAI